MTIPKSYICPKCGHSEHETSEIRAAGGFWSKIFDVQGRRFTTVICTRCRYTDMFQADSKLLGSIFDFLTQ